MSVFTNPATGAKEQSDAYIKATLEILGDKDPLQVLADQPAAVERLMEGLSTEDLRKPEAPGKWSMLEAIHHLADAELVWAYRLRMVLGEDRPQITGFDQDAWVPKLRYGDANPIEVLDQLKVVRQINLRLLRSLSPDQMQCVGLHQERGEETIAHMIRLNAGHDLAHLRQLERMKNQTS